MATPEELQAEIERLRAENEKLKTGKADPIKIKVSQKGAVSVYGLGRFPVTLYKEQWLQLLGLEKDIRAFIEANNEKLKVKA